MKFYDSAADGHMDLHQSRQREQSFSEAGCTVSASSGGSEHFIHLQPLCLEDCSPHLWCFLTFYKVLELTSSLRDSISGLMSSPSMLWSKVRAAETLLLELCDWALRACQLLSLSIACPSCCGDFMWLLLQQQCTF